MGLEDFMKYFQEGMLHDLTLRMLMECWGSKQRGISKIETNC